MCLISEEFPPETGWGGIGTYTYILARALVRLGHRVQVVARAWGSDKVEDIDGVCLHRIGIPEPSWRRGSRFLSLLFYDTRGILLWNLRVARRLGQISRAAPIDVIEAPEYRAQGLLTTLRRRGRPVVVKLHTPAFLCRTLDEVVAERTAWDVKTCENLEYRFARRASMLTSPSRKLAEDVARHWRLDSGKIRIVPNPIDSDLFRPSGSRLPEDLTILFVGRIERRKGVETLIEALPSILRRLPNVRLRLVGSDHRSGPGGLSMTRHLKRRLKELGIPESSVQFVGPVDRTTLPAWYGSAAVVVVPSRYENFPYTCLEAMACGTALVASDVGGIPEIVTHGMDGILVPPDQPYAMAAAIADLLASPSRRRELGGQARNTVAERFSETVVCAETVGAYRSALGG